jgi:hypothetical protein
LKRLNSYIPQSKQIKQIIGNANPSLALLGFHIYKADGLFKGDDTRENIIIITRSKLRKNERVS